MTEVIAILCTLVTLLPRSCSQGVRFGRPSHSLCQDQDRGWDYTSSRRFWSRRWRREVVAPPRPSPQHCPTEASLHTLWAPMLPLRPCPPINQPVSATRQTRTVAIHEIPAPVSSDATPASPNYHLDITWKVDTTSFPRLLVVETVRMRAEFIWEDWWSRRWVAQESTRELKPWESGKDFSWEGLIDTVLQICTRRSPEH